MALGGLTGIVAGLVAVALPGGPVLASGAILGTSLVGAGVGALMSSMAGSRRIKPFEEAIEKGEFLFMIDVPMDRVDEIETLIKKLHPDAECGGTEPEIPAFP